MNNVIALIRKELKKQADKNICEGAHRFFKEPVKLYGVKTSAVRLISRDFFKMIREKNKRDVFRLCEELWQSGFFEECLIASDWSRRFHAQYEEGDFKVFERWVKRYVSNWASCDTFCNHTVGELVEKFPRLLSHLKKWATSENRWVRRACAVSLIIPARKGLFLNDVFEIADELLDDEDDLVRKGYGWLLKAASQAHQKEVFEYVMKNKQHFPRTALRYAIEKMPRELRAEAMR